MSSTASPVRGKQSSAVQPGPEAQPPNDAQPPVVVAEPSLLQKLIKIAAEIGHIGKDGHNDHFKYAYASEKAIKEAVYPKLRDYGIVFKMDAVGLPEERGGALITLFHYSFIDAVSGETHEGDFLGSGRLGDDKGVYISVTGAIKYIMTTMLGIVTGDDPEADRPVDQRYTPKTNAEPAPANGADVVEVYCDSCKHMYPVSQVPPGSRFEASWPDKKSGRWEKGDKVFYCPKCPKGSKTILKLDTAIEDAHERRAIEQEPPADGGPYA